MFGPLEIYAAIHLYSCCIIQHSLFRNVRHFGKIDVFHHLLTRIFAFSFKCDIILCSIYGIYIYYDINKIIISANLKKFIIYFMSKFSSYIFIFHVHIICKLKSKFHVYLIFLVDNFEIRSGQSSHKHHNFRRIISISNKDFST